MDKRRSLLNISTALFFRVVLIALAFLTRRLLINHIGDDGNGLDSLFNSIISFLAVAELGIGTAITFCMYKPIVDGDKEKVAALYQLFRKAYSIVGIIIFAGGLAIMPLLPILAKGYTLSSNIYLLFFIMLVSVVTTYVYSAKTSLINAYKDNYITTLIHSIGQLILYGLQALVLFLTGSFYLYMFVRIISSVAQWIITDIMVKRKHKDILLIDSKLDDEIKKEVKKNVKAVFAHKIGGLLVVSADSVIISSFLSVKVLGFYSNYTLIATNISAVLALVFTPLTSIIGHFYYQSDKENLNRYLNFFHGLNSVLGFIFFLGFFGVIDDTITIMFGPDRNFGTIAVMVITMNYFIMFMESSVRLFKDSTGLFYYDRFKPFVEGIINVILSIIFVLWFGVTGVIAATIITNLFVCHIVEPFVLYKYGIKKSPKRYYIRNYTYMAIFSILMLLLNFIKVDNSNIYFRFLANGFIAVGVSFIGIAIVFITNKDFRYFFNEKILKRLLRVFKRRKRVEE